MEGKPAANGGLFPSNLLGNEPPLFVFLDNLAEISFLGKEVKIIMISTKKLVTIGAAAALFAATAVPAFAGHFGGGQFNFAGIRNSIVAGSNTGNNNVKGEIEHGGSTKTGDATTVVGVSNIANKNVNVSSCGCKNSQKNVALIGNSVVAGSNTGNNNVRGEVEGSTSTGDAGTGVVVSNVVNKNVNVGFGGGDHNDE